MGKGLPNAYEPQATEPQATPELGELDELETFVGSKKTKFRSRHL
ncbi:hypothetical protein AVDCRST_MAG81-2661 [uncultured Synechococcales cyanobacterium]|uniref:Uncharacterized protein n=1 Tax=uncultured Synechococcales cyanobacterium TaxID=1936017 RepID=A0A6J4VIV4_9CYAN|nr:hypothetical protein AVDCRST_MAG81-2661 [uncultured Synechococcales cyanobacterium]